MQVCYYERLSPTSYRKCCVFFLQAPKPPDPWQNVRNAVRFGNVCPQAGSYHYTQEVFQGEDCLYLNIYVPYKVKDTGYSHTLLSYQVNDYTAHSPQRTAP